MIKHKGNSKTDKYYVHLLDVNEAKTFCNNGYTNNMYDLPKLCVI